MEFGESFSRGCWRLLSLLTVASRANQHWSSEDLRYFHTGTPGAERAAEPDRLFGAAVIQWGQQQWNHLRDSGSACDSRRRLHG